MNARSLLLWDVERSHPVYLLLVAVLALVLILVTDDRPTSGNGILVKTIKAGTYLVMFDPSNRSTDRSSDALLRAAGDIQTKTRSSALTPLYSGDRLEAVIVGPERRKAEK